MSKVGSFLDVDFTQCPEFVPGFNGYGDTGRFANYADEGEVYTETQLLEIFAEQKPGECLDDLVTRIMDQKQEGSCVANATAQALQVLMALYFGMDRVIQLSAMSLYQLIGRSPSSGAVVMDALDAIQETGVLPLDTEENKKRFKHTMPHTGFYTKRPDGCEETAAMFKGVEALRINNYLEGFSALAKREPVVVGRKGHSICYLRGLNDNGSLASRYANSWTPNWGDKGFGVDSKGTAKSAFNGAFALRTVTVPTFQE